ncbi:MAG: tyrosine--tRNA ligase [Chloroflexi bacterium]|nr:tyrosine--tRNA ligase [Chloroflexota bacterium]
MPLGDLAARGMIEGIIVEKELAELVQGGRRLTVYQGFDPTGPKLHIGHLVALRILRWFQLQGHRVIFLVGDFTGRIGDPTDKAATRKTLSEDQVLENARTYQEQAGLVLDFAGENPAELRFNSEWLDAMTFRELAEVASHLTVQQLIERDMFQERLKKQRPIALHEFLYPMMQGYDSVAMEADVEVGGRDQLFNMMTGRDLVRHLQERSKHVITTPLLPGLNDDKMGKTEGNTVDLTEKPAAMFHQLTQIRDSLLPQFLSILTDASEDEIAAVKARLEAGESNLMDAREHFAGLVVARLHGDAAASDALQEFRRVVVEQQLPSDIEVVELDSQKIPPEGIDLISLLTEAGRASSRSDARRLVKQNAVRLNDERKADPRELIPGDALRDALLQVGKQSVLRLGLRDGSD